MYVLFVCFKIYVSFIHPNKMYTSPPVRVCGRAQHNYFGANKIEKATTLEVFEVKSNKQSDQSGRTLSTRTHITAEHTEMKQHKQKPLCQAVEQIFSSGIKYASDDNPSQTPAKI